MNLFSLDKNKILNILAVFIVGFFAVSAYVTKPSFLTIQTAESSTAENVTGYAWAWGGGTSSDGVGVGAISFNNLSDRTGIGYGVNVNEAYRSTASGPGVFSGNAWSEHIGWISFDLASAGYFPGAETGASLPGPIAKPFSGWTGTALAQVQWGGTNNAGNAGKVTGWARALAACASVPCPTTGPIIPGGWDGWIKLSEGTLTSNPSHRWTLGGEGVKITAGGNFSGYAYGGDVLGWIQFDPKGFVQLVPGDSSSGVPLGVKIGGTSCLPTTLGVVWATDSDGTDSCSAESLCNSSTSGQTLFGQQGGTCSGGSGSGFTTRTCSTVCPVVAPPPPATAGCNSNLVCESGENFSTCPSDCKAGFIQS